RSVDLIFALPKQTMAEWREDLEQAIALGLDHLSLYNLTYEDDTPLTLMMQRGEVEPLPEAVQAEMFEYTIGRCRNAGLHQYEVSNFAKLGRESLHNTLYWRCENWLGIGPSAHSGFDGRRWGNVADHRVYAKRMLDDGTLPVAFEEENDLEAQADEMLLMGLRLRAGVKDIDMRSRLGFGIAERCGPALDELAGQGLVDWDGSVLKASEQGLPLLDAIVLELTRAPMALA
ncbi:MAG: coproporphyrinogen III oxidase, partial [Planctomycetes bacterium]|nr:coproporphyrinogen III oxidase [Planctomycetota bacterium]